MPYESSMKPGFDDEEPKPLDIIVNWVVNAVLIALGAFLVFRILVEAVAVALGLK